MRLNQGYRYRHVLSPDSLGHTALSYLVGAFAHSNQSEWQARFQAGEILLDDKLANGSESLQPGKIIVWNRPGWLEEETPQNYSVVYRDEHLLVVDKPSGLPTIPGAGFYLNTLLEIVRNDFPAARALHRLGRATSGLVLFALDTHTASAIQRNWSQIHKQYQALGGLVASQDVYDIQTPIGPCDHPRLGKVYAASSTGKCARSIARVIQRRLDSTLFEVDLHTGRPHQIRIHLASIGHPLVGDPLYAAGGQPKLEQPALPGDAGYWLHAKRVILQHPITGQQFDLTSPLPEILRTD